MGNPIAGALEFLEENNGGRSYVRGIGFFVTAMLIGKNVYLSVKLGQNIEFSIIEAGLITTLLGWKVLQKGKEGNETVEEKKP